MYVRFSLILSRDRTLALLRWKTCCYSIIFTQWRKMCPKLKNIWRYLSKYQGFKTEMSQRGPTNVIFWKAGVAHILVLCTSPTYFMKKTLPWIQAYIKWFLDDINKVEEIRTILYEFKIWKTRMKKLVNLYTIINKKQNVLMFLNILHIIRSCCSNCSIISTGLYYLHSWSHSHWTYSDQ